MKYSYQDALAFYGVEGAHPGGFPLTKQILQSEKINQHSKILDAGCGTGQTSAYLAQTFGCQVFAIDMHPEMVKKAIKRFQENQQQIKIYQGSVEQLPFPKDSFDYIIAESSTAFTDIHKSLKEYHRVLKPNGVLITIDLTVEPFMSKEAKLEIITVYNMKALYTEKEWLKALKLAGFKKRKILKANTVFDEILETNVTEAEVFPVQIYHAEMYQAMEAHEKILMTYGNRLGYRVYRACKRDSETN